MLVGKKVVLESVAPESIEQFRLWRNDPQLRRYFREYRDITPDQQLTWYQTRGNNSSPEHVFFQVMSKDQLAPTEELAVERRYLIGCCNLSYIDFRLRNAEFGVYLSHTERGQGKGKEALELMFDYGFNELNLHRIWAQVYDNNPAIEVYRKLGFRDEGVARDSYFHDGHYGNSYMISLLEDEWRG